MRREDLADLKMIALDDPGQSVGISAIENPTNGPEGVIFDVTLMIAPRLFREK